MLKDGINVRQLWRVDSILSQLMVSTNSDIIYCHNSCLLMVMKLHVALQVGNYMEYRCKADSAQSVTHDDGSVALVDNRCWVRTGHSICQKGAMLYVFGGLLRKDETKSNDV